MSEKFSKKEQQKEKLLPDYLEEAKKIEEELDSMEDPWADDDEIEEKMRLRREGRKSPGYIERGNMWRW